MHITTCTCIAHASLAQLIMDLETTNVIQTIKSLVEAIQTTTRISERMHEEGELRTLLLSSVFNPS